MNLQFMRRSHVRDVGTPPLGEMSTAVVAPIGCGLDGRAATCTEVRSSNPADVRESNRASKWSNIFIPHSISVLLKHFQSILIDKLEFKIILTILAINIINNASALKIGDTHYQFCVMDDATITDKEADDARRADRLPFFLDAYWYTFNGVKINGTDKFIKTGNTQTDIKVLFTEVYNGNECSISHSWGKGMGSYVKDMETYIYIDVDAPSGVSFDNVPSTILIGDEKSVKTTLLGSYTSFSGNGYFDYKYSSSDPEILSIDSERITTKKKGTVIITVEAYIKNKKYDGEYYIGSASQEIDVVEDLNPTNISVDPTELELYIGQESSVSTILTPKEAETTITWLSSDENIVSVNNGHVKAISEGFANIIAKTSNGLTAQCSVNVMASPTVEISDINSSWGTSQEQVIADQDGGYYLIQQNESFLIFKKVSDDLSEIYLSYKFDKDGKLCASALSMPDNKNSQQFVDDYICNCDSEISVIEGLEVTTNNRDLSAIDISTSLNGGNIITIGLSYFEPLEERDDCVDLGLSVRWATTNLGATTPYGVGNFYAFSETKTKLEYWRENYSYCKNESNPYIFEYFNPETNICGTKYDAATVHLGDGWKMPSLAEVNELIAKCTWETETIEGTKVFRVTGPNGNSIILPFIGYKWQDKEDYYNNNLRLGIGECPSKRSEDTYVLTTEWNNDIYTGIIDNYWKAWGYNIRPVYIK